MENACKWNIPPHVALFLQVSDDANPTLSHCQGVRNSFGEHLKKEFMLYLIAQGPVCLEKGMPF